MGLVRASTTSALVWWVDLRKKGKLSAENGGHVTRNVCWATLWWGRRTNRNSEYGSRTNNSFPPLRSYCFSLNDFDGSCELLGWNTFSDEMKLTVGSANEVVTAGDKQLYSLSHKLRNVRTSRLYICYTIFKLQQLSSSVRWDGRTRQQRLRWHSRCVIWDTTKKQILTYFIDIPCNRSAFAILLLSLTSKGRRGINKINGAESSVNDTRLDQIAKHLGPHYCTFRCGWISSFPHSTPRQA